MISSLNPTKYILKYVALKQDYNEKHQMFAEEINGGRPHSSKSCFDDAFEALRRCLIEDIADDERTLKLFISFFGRDELFFLIGAKDLKLFSD